MTRLEHYNRTSHDQFEANLSWNKAATMAKYQRELRDEDVMVNVYRCVICSAYIQEESEDVIDICTPER